MNECRTVKSIIVYTKTNGFCTFLSSYGYVYVRENIDRIIMSDWKDFLRLVYCNYTDLNGYRIVENNDSIKVRRFVEEEKET